MVIIEAIWGITKFVLGTELRQPLAILTTFWLSSFPSLLPYRWWLIGLGILMAILDKLFSMVPYCSPINYLRCGKLNCEPEETESFSLYLLIFYLFLVLLLIGIVMARMIGMSLLKNTEVINKGGDK